MTSEEYVGAVQELARRREYGPMIDFAERVGPEFEDQLTAEQVRVLRVHLKHADMVMSQVRSRINLA
jgi:hypothetical protein